jgi:hypothetical protein
MQKISSSNNNNNNKTMVIAQENFNAQGERTQTAKGGRDEDRNARLFPREPRGCL